MPFILRLIFLSTDLFLGPHHLPNRTWLLFLQAICSLSYTPSLPSFPCFPVTLFQPNLIRECSGLLLKAHACSHLPVCVSLFLQMFFLSPRPQESIAPSRSHCIVPSHLPLLRMILPPIRGFLFLSYSPQSAFNEGSSESTVLFPPNSDLLGGRNLALLFWWQL